MGAVQPHGLEVLASPCNDLAAVLEEAAVS
jgi:hypothetical protein